MNKCLKIARIELSMTDKQVAVLSLLVFFFWIGGSHLIRSARERSCRIGKNDLSE